MKQVAIAGALGLVIFVGGSGCSTVQPRKDFDALAADAQERVGGARVYWNTGTRADAEVGESVAALLKDERGLSADASVQVALLNNRSLQAEYEQLAVAQADLVEAGLLKNPVFSGEVRFPTTGGGQPAVVLDVVQDFLSLLMLPSLQARAGAAAAAARARVTGAVMDVALGTRLAYYDYQGAVQTRGMRATVLDATAASYDLAERLRAAGNIRELDLANEHALYGRAKLDLANAELDEAVKRERLTALMGLFGPAAAFKVAQQLPDLPDAVAHPLLSPQEAERAAVERSVDLASMRAEVEVAGRSAGIVNALGWLTDADIGVSAERESGKGSPWTVGPSLSVPIPLFDQGQVSGVRAGAALRQAAARYYAEAVEVRSRARSAQQVATGSHDRAAYLKEVLLPLRQRILEQTQLQYNAMQVSAFELLRAKRDEIDTAAEWVEALRDAWKARATLEQIVRGRLPETEDGAGITLRKHTSEGARR
jgi:cobalt-zinc-cadmium efflux system outer membrane protein